MPSHFGTYKVLEKLAQGSMGEVYKVESEDGKVYALKAVRKQEFTSDDNENEQRFKRENSLFRQMKHENIVRVYDSQLEEEPQYMVMEYISGGSLEDLLKDKPLLPKKVLSIAVDIAAALCETEKIGIVHRDIKPGNILIGEDCYKLTDLGLARHQQVEYEDGLTLSQTALGTPHYISPEQVLHARGVDIRSDIYSLGATLYHCLTGERVHEGGSHMQIMMKQVHEPVKSPVELDPSTPPALSRAIMRMLEKEPDDRFQNPAELLDALKSIRTEDSKGEIEDPQAIKPKNMVGMLMFICFVFLIIFASGAFVRMACVPPIEDDPSYQKSRKGFERLDKVNSTTLMIRADKIKAYLDDYPRDLDRERIRRAEHLARQFARDNEYKLIVHKVGTFKKARKFEMRLSIGGQKFKVSATQDKEVFYPNEKIKFNWHVDQEVRIVLEEFDWLSEVVFDKTFKAQQGLKQLSGERFFKLSDEYKDYFDKEQLELKFSLHGVSEADWSIFSDYIFPGDKW